MTLDKSSFRLQPLTSTLQTSQRSSDLMISHENLLSPLSLMMKAWVAVYTWGRYQKRFCKNILEFSMNCRWEIKKLTFSFKDFSTGNGLEMHSDTIFFSSPKEISLFLIFFKTFSYEHKESLGECLQRINFTQKLLWTWILKFV